MEYFNMILAALNQLGVQMIVFIPKIIVAIAIWLIGKYLINLGVALIKKVGGNCQRLDPDDSNCLGVGVRESS